MATFCNSSSVVPLVSGGKGALAAGVDWAEVANMTAAEAS